jgi:hypothetical protein
MFMKMAESAAMAHYAHLLPSSLEDAIEDRRPADQAKQLDRSSAARIDPCSAHNAARLRAHRGVVIRTTENHVSDLFVLY